MQVRLQSYALNPTIFCAPWFYLLIKLMWMSFRGGHLLEPVLFTLAVFNRSTRNLSKAWRPLGLVTDANRRSTAQNANTAKASPISLYYVIFFNHLTMLL